MSPTCQSPGAFPVPYGALGSRASPPGVASVCGVTRFMAGSFHKSTVVLCPFQLHVSLSPLGQPVYFPLLSFILSQENKILLVLSFLTVFTVSTSWGSLCFSIRFREAQGMVYQTWLMHSFTRSGPPSFSSYCYRVSSTGALILFMQVQPGSTSLWVCFPTSYLMPRETPWVSVVHSHKTQGSEHGRAHP